MTSARKPASPLDRIADLRAPAISHYGTADRFVPQDDVAEFERALAEADKSYELFAYRGAPHSFDEDHRPRYRPVAAREAWQRTLTFLDWYIGTASR
jgi:carboxymethylenebutenolidase